MVVASSDALFSVELVVDSLTIPNETCLFPAIAFRLLDYPTLIIHNINPLQGDTIRRKLISDKSPLPKQFPALLDGNGSFTFGKGKSCLLKMKVDTLLKHLQNTPLYIMIIDMWSETPKLVASCSLSLKSLMEAVHSEVTRLGLSTPVISGEKGEHAVYNLMGQQTGTISLGYRILSLGSGLSPHLPDDCFVHVKPVKPETEKGHISVVEPVENYPPKPRIQTDKSTGVDFIVRELRTEATQTSIILSAALDKGRRPVSTQTPKTALKSNTDDAFDKDHLHRPPPLFFRNDDTDERIPDDIDHVISNEPNDDLDLVEFETEGIQSRPVEKSAEPTALPRPVPKDVLPLPQTQAPFIKCHDFPLLNALMVEISKLNSQPPTSQPAPSSEPCAPAAPVKRNPVVPVPRKVEKISDFSWLPRQSRDRPCRSRHPEGPYGEKAAVPRNRGWIRVQEEYGRRKSKLKYGLTNTLKLRVQRTHGDQNSTLDNSRQVPRPRSDRVTEGHLVTHTPPTKVRAYKVSPGVKSRDGGTGSQPIPSDQRYDDILDVPRFDQDRTSVKESTDDSTAHDVDCVFSSKSVEIFIPQVEDTPQDTTELKSKGKPVPGANNFTDEIMKRPLSVDSLEEYSDDFESHTKDDDNDGDGMKANQIHFHSARVPLKSDQSPIQSGFTREHNNTTPSQSRRLQTRVSLTDVSSGNSSSTPKPSRSPPPRPRPVRRSGSSSFTSQNFDSQLSPIDSDGGSDY